MSRPSFYKNEQTLLLAAQPPAFQGEMDEFARSFAGANSSISPFYRGGAAFLQVEVSSRFSLCRQRRQRTPVALVYMEWGGLPGDAADRQETSTCKGAALQAADKPRCGIFYRHGVKVFTA